MIDSTSHARSLSFDLKIAEGLVKEMARYTNYAQCPVGHLFDVRTNGRKCPYCGRIVGQRSSKTVDVNVEAVEESLLYVPVEPVCGWLACIDGARKGQSFVLHAGKNFIGRGDDMDVQILGDLQIARRNHAVIAYDPKNRKFMLVPGESEGLVYLNGQSVYQATLLLDMSMIQLGNTTLVFRPLCGDNFDWDI